MKKSLGLVIGAMFLFPAVSFAATLTTPQISAIVGLLQAFGVGQPTLGNVQTILEDGGGFATITATISTSTKSLAVQASASATSTPDVNMSVFTSSQPQVYGSVASSDDTDQASSTPVVSIAPTCTITATIGSDGGATVSWITTNATSGIFFMRGLYAAGVWKPATSASEIPMIPITAGSNGPDLAGANNGFEGNVTGPDGTGVCSTQGNP